MGPHWGDIKWYSDEPVQNWGHRVQRERALACGCESLYDPTSDLRKLVFLLRPNRQQLVVFRCCVGFDDVGRDEEEACATRTSLAGWTSIPWDSRPSIPANGLGAGANRSSFGGGGKSSSAQAQGQMRRPRGCIPSRKPHNTKIASILLENPAAQLSVVDVLTP
jgi:hypothetical protein